jgi:hypothetical protein
MSKSFEARIECPFYFEEEDNYIKCEGIINNSLCTHEFPNRETKKEYIANVCSVNCGKKCLHYRNLHTLYDLELR